MYALARAAMRGKTKGGRVWRAGVRLGRCGELGKAGLTMGLGAGRRWLGEGGAGEGGLGAKQHGMYVTWLVQEVLKQLRRLWHTPSRGLVATLWAARLQEGDLQGCGLLRHIGRTARDFSFRLILEQGPPMGGLHRSCRRSSPFVVVIVTIAARSAF